MALLFANNNSLSAITTKPSGLSGGALNLISTQTASSSSTLSFTSGIDDSYDEYVFKFYDIHPATNDQRFSFQVDTGTNTNYNQTITSTFFYAYHDEADSQAGLSYVAGRDQAQGTAFQAISDGVGNDNDQSTSGYLHLFDPSSTTFIKNFIALTNINGGDNISTASYAAGYINTSTAITRVQFKFASGNIDSGTIKMYGLS